MITVTFNNIPISEGQLLSKAYARLPIDLDWDMEDGVYYTVIIYDVDGPFPSSPEYPYCHYLAVNVTASYGRGDDIITYAPPNPPNGDHPHTYYIDIYTQYGKTYPDYDINYIRPQFDIDSFVTRHNLDLFDQTYFLVKPDKIPSN